MSLTRRRFLRMAAGAGLAAAPSACVVKKWLFRPPLKKPNIILFLVDDLGWQDVSVPFFKDRTPLNARCRTPNVERLAADGMKFTQAYASAVCSPTRVSLMTGMNAARHRVTNWTLRKNVPTDAAHETLDFPAWNVNGMSPVPGVERTAYGTPLPALLREAGYRTIHCGKAHFGAIDTPGADPKSLGFEVNIAGHAAGGPGSYLGEHGFSAAWRKGESVWDVPGLEAYHGRDVFLTEALTREALKAVEAAVKDRKPFFLHMAHYAVHTPIEEDQRFIQSYLDAGLDPIEAKYAAMIEGMDKSLGDIMGYLERRGLAGETIILFMSDNGGLSAAARGGTPHTHNRPLSSGKGSAHEGGIRGPMVVKWPGVVRGESACETPVIIEDFFPTILEMAGVRGAETVQPVDGRSFVPLLRGSSLFPRNRPLFWHFPNNWGPAGPGIGASSTVRRADWKLIYYHADRRFELFNLAEDIGETENLAGKRPEKAEELASLLTVYLKSVDAQMPVDRGTGEPVPWPSEALAGRGGVVLAKVGPASRGSFRRGPS
ncbi:MAG: sulfatase [Candidatus Aminicenantes bacterium]|nr:sulfatase [Candidatus Aminicenantes bacterium]